MNTKLICWLIGMLCALTLQAQNEYPTANPTMTYVDADGAEQNETQYDGSAPFKATFKANPENVGNYTPLYEWRFTRNGESAPFLVRNDEDTEFDFNQSGSYTVELLISFVQGTDTIEYVMDQPFSVTISESKLEVPNAFTPNGDGINDVCVISGEAGNEPGVTYIVLDDSKYSLENGTTGRLLYTVGRNFEEKRYLRPIPKTALNINPDLGQNYYWR